MWGSIISFALLLGSAFCASTQEERRQKVEMMKLAREYDGKTLDCYECPDKFSCNQESENWTKQTAPQFTLSDNNMTGEMAACHIDIQLWQQCADGPHSFGLLVTKRYLELIPVRSASDRSTRRWDLLTDGRMNRDGRKYYECFQDSCNFELPPCENRTQIFPCPENDEPSRYAHMQPAFMELNKDCSNMEIINCYSCKDSLECAKSTNELNTTRDYLGKGAFFNHCLAEFKTSTDGSNVSKRSVTPPGFRIPKMEAKCVCKGKNCEKTECSCHESFCNAWNEPPCKPAENERSCTF